MRPPEVLEASVKLKASVPSVSSEVLTDDSPSPQEPVSVRPLTKPEPTVQSVSSEIVKDETAPQEPSSKRSLTTDLTTDTISSNFDTTNLQHFDEISSTAYAEVGPGSLSEISSDSRTESESISEQVNFLKGKFLSTNALLGVLNSATETLTEIPRTVKENVYFVLDHSSNISKKSNNTRMDHWDNCGIWETTSTSLKTTYFVRQENGTLKFCDKKKDGKFYREVRKRMVLLDPQPNETNLVEMKCYYAKLQRDPKYEKRSARYMHA